MTDITTENYADVNARVLHVVALAAALYWLRVCETLLVRFGLLRMEGVDAS